MPKLFFNLKKSIILLSILLSLNVVLFAQSKMDSLKNNIQLAAGNDSIQAERYMDVAFEILFYTSDELETGLEYIHKAIKLSEKGPYIGQLMTEHNYIGIVKREQGKSEEAITAYKKTIALGEEEYKKSTPERRKKLDKNLPKVKDNIANVYNEIGKIDEALQVRLSVIADLKRQKDKEGLAVAYGNISGDFMKAHKYEQAIDYSQKGIALYKVDSNNKSLPYLYGNLGLCYDRLGDQDSALHYYLLCRAISKDFKQLYLDNEAYIASLYASQKKYTLSNRTFENLFSQYETNSNNGNLNYYKLLAAESYLEQNNFSKARQLFEQSKDHLTTDKLAKRKKLGEVGMRINRESNNYREALLYADIFHNAKDSMNNARRDSSFHLIENKYNVAKKQETINAQKVKIRNYGLGLLGLLALGIIAALLFYNYKKQQTLKEKLASQEAKAKESEIENLKKENQLISMSSMIEGQEEERKRIAQDLHDNIGTLMTSIKMKFLTIQKEIESISKMNITDELDGMINSASQEVRRISHRMTPKILEHAGLHDSVKELEVQLTENNIEVKSNIEALKGIDDKKIELNLYRIVQETYNNIIKHSGADKVSIVTDKESDSLTLRIRDNGKGISLDKWEDKNTLGLNGIKSRVNYLNGKLKLVKDSGTHFKITIPLA